MIETILVAVGPEEDDRIEKLAEQATNLASMNDAKVVLLHVFDNGSYDDTLSAYEQTLDNLGFDRTSGAQPSPTEVAQRQTAARALKELLEENDVDVEIQGKIGDRGEEIVSTAAELEADNIVVGGRKRSPTGKAMFGSVAQDVLMNADAPVTFVRTEGDRKKTFKNAL